MPQILTPGTLHVTKLCCVMDNHATENELARSSSVLPANHPLTNCHEPVKHIFFRTYKLEQLSRQFAVGMIRFNRRKS